jgi:hypothetical protein
MASLNSEVLGSAATSASREKSGVRWRTSLLVLFLNYTSTRWTSSTHFDPLVVMGSTEGGAQR